MLLVAPSPVCLLRNSIAVSFRPAGADMVDVLRAMGLPTILVMVEIRACKRREAEQSRRQQMKPRAP